MTDKSSNSPAMAFILDYLKEHGDSPYAQIREAAEQAGHNIYPIMYGRAKSLLGLLTEDSKRRRRKADRKSAKLRQGATEPAEGTVKELSSFVERYHEIEEERNRYRAALLHVEKLLKDALEASD